METKESGLAYEIRKLEAKLNRKHTKAVKALEDRILHLEGGLAELGAWVASRIRAEAQAAVDAEAEPAITAHSEEGEPWITKLKDIPIVTPVSKVWR